MVRGRGRGTRACRPPSGLIVKVGAAIPPMAGPAHSPAIANPCIFRGNRGRAHLELRPMVGFGGVVRGRVRVIARGMVRVIARGRVRVIVRGGVIVRGRVIVVISLAIVIVVIVVVVAPLPIVIVFVIVVMVGVTLTIVVGTLAVIVIGTTVGRVRVRSRARVIVSVRVRNNFFRYRGLQAPDLIAEVSGSLFH